MSDRLRVATAAPTPQVELEGGAPGTLRRTRSGAPFRLDVFPGTHTALVFRHLPPGVTIVSNNPNVSDSGDSLTWIDAQVEGKKKLFFFTLPDRTTPDTTLFVRKDGQAGERAFFQVRTVPFKGGKAVRVLLHGKGVSLNAEGGGIVPYDLDVNLRVPSGEPLGKHLDDALRLAGGSIDHLVVNAHGGVSDSGEASIVIGDHFTRGTVGLWDRLAGKVRYVWFQNCVVGNDNELMGEIARRTKAWVSAPFMSLPIGRFPKGQIDLTFGNHKHFNSELPFESGETSVVRKRTTFFRHARRSNAPNLTDGLSFSIVERPV